MVYDSSALFETGFFSGEVQPGENKCLKRKMVSSQGRQIMVNSYFFTSQTLLWHQQIKINPRQMAVNWCYKKQEYLRRACYDVLSCHFFFIASADFEPPSIEQIRLSTIAMSGNHCLVCDFLVILVFRIPQS